MRKAVFLLILAAVSFPDNATVVRFMNVTTGTSCPGDWLYMNATASDGTPAPDVELRLVLYEPYLGLRALEHTDENGLASVQLTRTGHYRLYMYTNDYNHDDYVEFDYPSLCPPPPPLGMNVSVSVDCADRIVSITAASNGTPLSGVFVAAQEWSSLTGDSGEVSIPLQEGDLFINATRQGYTSQAFYYTVSCVQPQCTDPSQCSDNQACLAQECVNLTGSCGYAANHTWNGYACCTDSDCGALSRCVGNTCVPREMPPFIQNQDKTNVSSSPANNSSELPSPSKPNACLGSILLLGIVYALSARKA